MSNLAETLTEHKHLFSPHKENNSIFRLVNDELETDILPKINNKLTCVFDSSSSESDLPDVQLKTLKSEKLDDEFYCIIDSVNFEQKTITAKVYDIVEKIQIMDISSDFDEFSKQEQDNIKNNAIFYWRIGSRTITKIKGDKESKQTKNFSEFRMKLSYISPRSLETRLQSKVNRLSKIFA